MALVGTRQPAQIDKPQVCCQICDGFQAVWDRIKDEVSGKKIYVSVDIDVLDTAHVPGTSNPEPSGMTSMQLLSMIRGLAIQNEVIMIDFVEYSPLLDDRH